MTSLTRNSTRRRCVDAVAVVALCFVATVVAPRASADDTCEYALSPPYRATLAGGVVQITATLTPLSCHGDASPGMNTVCLSAVDSKNVCTTIPGWDVAQAYVPPSNSGSYVSTGNGCVDRLSELRLTCVPYGPLKGRA
jgi:hypothetical protein